MNPQTRRPAEPCWRRLCGAAGPGRPGRRDRARRPAFTLLELLITLVIVALLIVAVLRVLQQTQAQTLLMQGDLARRGGLESCLDLLEQDLAEAAANFVQLSLENVPLQADRQSARLIIASRPGGPQAAPAKRVEWVTAPRLEQEDLVLFRRVALLDQPPTPYVPVCENLYSFEVRQPSELLIEVTARMFRSDRRDPKDTWVATRTFCTQRFRL